MVYYIKGDPLYEAIKKIPYPPRTKVKLIIFLLRTLKDIETRY
jgi:hypothetical protein